MSTNKIFCLGDGYAHGHIWPEWPQILQALLPDHQIITVSGVGSGNEYLVSELLAQGHAVRNQMVVFQWANPLRFDKLIEDQDWENVGKSDAVYAFNFYQCQDRRWWLSSASANPRVKTYHDMVQKKQAQLRTENYKILTQNYLQNQQCSFYFTSTEAQERYARQSRFVLSRGDQVQPSPPVHFLFLKEIILPNLPMVVDLQRMSLLQQRIEQHAWVPYDPDREEIWRIIQQF